MTECGCGCGETTSLATRTRNGYKRGESLRFIRGHNARSERTPFAERFWGKVEPTGFCWEWSAHRDRKGYGRFGGGGNSERTILAHRIAYEELVGPIPEGAVLDHLCRNRGCVNPDHLEPVSPAENSRRGFAGQINRQRIRSAFAECKNGHPAIPENLYQNPTTGLRRCRPCHAAGSLRRYHERRKRVVNLDVG